jgi:hypothetical protein
MTIKIRREKYKTKSNFSRENRPTILLFHFFGLCVQRKVKKSAGFLLCNTGVKLERECSPILAREISLSFSLSRERRWVRSLKQEGRTYVVSTATGVELDSRMYVLLSALETDLLTPLYSVFWLPCFRQERAGRWFCSGATSSRLLAFLLIPRRQR